jgi:lysozyme family protein
MAAFERCLNILLNTEGGYSNHELDSGKETYRGISRKFWPDWKGWLIIDEYREHKLFPKLLELDEDLQKLVSIFYEENFWKASKAYAVAVYDVNAAFRLFDFAVNAGIPVACKQFQIVCNTLNWWNKAPLYPSKLAIDGDIGSNTQRAFKMVIEKRGPEVFLDYFKATQLNHYTRIIEKKPNQSVFAYGWAKRVAGV